MLGKTRVLILSTAYLPQIGGSELAIKNVTDRLPEIEFDLITSRLSKDVLPYEKVGNVNVYRVGDFLGLFSFLLSKPFLPVSVFLKACKLIRKNGPYDLVHAFQASQAAGGGWLLKWVYPKILFLLTVQEGKTLNKQPWLLKFFRNFIFKKADAATVISSYLAEYVRSQNLRIPITVIPNGVDLQKFKIKNDPFDRFDKLTVVSLPNHKTQAFGSEAQARRGHPEQSRTDEKLKINEKVIITVSRLVEKNGVGDLIEAFHILNSKFKILNSKLLIIGKGPLRRNYELRIKSYGLEDRIKLVDNVLPDEVPKYLALADVFVRPSLSEGLGTAFLEAMAAGVPVVGTPVGGIPDFLKDRETGLFCQTSNPDDIAKKIADILTNTDLKNKLVLNARRLIEEKYSWDKIAEEYRNLYDLISSSSSSS